MTFLKNKQVVERGLLRTFKIQRQVYRLTGSLLSPRPDDYKDDRVEYVMVITLYHHWYNLFRVTVLFALLSNVYHSMTYTCITGSKFPFLMKLCFSKWSKMWQKFGDLTSLIFNTKRRNIPCLFNRYEHDSNTVEYRVSRVTRATNDDWPWTLWDMRDLATEATDPDPRIPTGIQLRHLVLLGYVAEPADRTISWRVNVRRFFFFIHPIHDACR
jgi:hypothetical protein